jgi:hypothetical protein
MIFDNHQQLRQCVEHDPVEEQQRCGTAGQPTEKSYLSIPSPKPRFVRQLDDFHQQDVSKYLVLELCHRGNNKDVIIIILIHDNVYIPC